MRSYFNHYLHVVTAYPKAVLLVVFLIALALAAGLPNFRLDASSDSLTLEHDKDLKYFREMSKQYQSGDFLVVTFRPNEDLFSDASLGLLRDLRDDLAEIDGVVSVNTILDVPLLYSPKQSVREILAGTRTLDAEDVDRELAKREFLESPIYRELILGPEGQTTALQLNLALDTRFIELVQRRDALRLKRDIEGLSETEQEALNKVSEEFLAYRTAAETRAHERVDEVRNITAQYKDRAQIFVGGVTMITADMIQFIRNDLVVFGTAVVVFMVALLAFIFRSLRFVLIPMSCCLVAVLMMLGLVSWLDWRLTVISSNFVALLLIISLAIIIHLVVRYREYAAANPDWDQRALVKATLTFMARPCLYTALTTIVAFASLVVSDIRPVIDFGWMMTIGLMVALVLAFLLMPAFLMLLPREASRQKTKTRSEKNSRTPKALTLYFSAIVERHGVKVLGISVVLAALNIYGLTQLEVENRFIDYFHESTEIYQGLSVIDNTLGGTTSLDIVISPPQFAQPDETIEDDPFAELPAEQEQDPFATPDDPFEDDPFAEDPFGDGAAADKEKNYWLTVSGLKRIEAVHDYLESLPEIGKVQSLATLYKVGNDISGRLNDFELAVLERSLPAEIRGFLISPYISPKSDDTRITMRIKDTYPNLKRRELVERIHTHLTTELGYEETDIKISGLLVLYNNMLQSLFSSQIVTLGAVFLGIMLMFLVLFRSFVIAVVAILPNMLAAITVLGTMGLIGLPLDMMTITVAAITVGIGVDDTIHYIHRFKEEIKVDGDYVAAMHRAHGSIGRAMYYTSIIIIFGFSIMVLSEFIPTIYFGILTGFAMLAALMGALLLLPKLILLVRPFDISASRTVRA